MGYFGLVRIWLFDIAEKGPKSPFPEAFAGYGENKVTWMKQVRRSSLRLIGNGFTCLSTKITGVSQR